MTVPYLSKFVVESVVTAWRQIAHTCRSKLLKLVGRNIKLYTKKCCFFVLHHVFTSILFLQNGTPNLVHLNFFCFSLYD